MSTAWISNFDNRHDNGWVKYKNGFVYVSEYLHKNYTYNMTTK